MGRPILKLRTPAEGARANEGRREAGREGICTGGGVSFGFIGLGLSNAALRPGSSNAA
jgi:hypothetical protein